MSWLSTMQAPERSTGHRPFALAMPFACAITLWATCLAAEEPRLLHLKPCKDRSGPVIDSRKVDFPDLGAESEVEVGQSMISALRADVVEDGLTLDSAATFSGTYFGVAYQVEVPAGPLVPITLKGVRAYSTPLYRFNYRNGKPRTGLSRPDIAVLVDPHDRHSLIGEVLLGFTTKSASIPDAKFTVSTCLAAGVDAYRHELIYTGVSHGTVSIEYREFLNDLARPAFSQELKYDLTDSSEIGYKGARFQILKATNVGIRFKVLKPLD